MTRPLSAGTTDTTPGTTTDTAAEPLHDVVATAVEALAHRFHVDSATALETLRALSETSLRSVQETAEAFVGHGLLPPGAAMLDPGHVAGARRRSTCGATRSTSPPRGVPRRVGASWPWGTRATTR